MFQSVVKTAQINPMSYVVIGDLGSGAFGRVVKVQNKNDVNDVEAAKILLGGDYHQVEAEIKATQLHHPALINYKGYSPVDFDGKKNYVIFMEIAEKGSLQNIFDLQSLSMKPDEFDSTTLLLTFIAISKGMEILHRNNIIHRDLTARNIAFVNGFYPKIIDFGLAKLNANALEPNIYNRAYGLIGYMAPEILHGNPYSKAADVYSFGVLINKAIDAFPDFDFTDEVFTNLIDDCQSYNPDNRPTFEYIYMSLIGFVLSERINHDVFDVDRILDYCQQLEVDESFYVPESKNGMMTYVYYAVGAAAGTGIVTGAYGLCKKMIKDAAEKAAKEAAKKAAEAAAANSGGFLIDLITTYGIYKFSKKTSKIILRSIQSFL